MKEMGKGYLTSYSIKPILMLSIALNVCFISRLIIVYEEGDEVISVNTTATGFCLKEEQEATTNRDSSSSTTADNNCSGKQQAHVSTRRRRTTTTTLTGGGGDGDVIIDLDVGDPTMYEKYWQQMGDKITVVISGWQYISYFSDVRNLCWFLEPEFANAVIRLHQVVGNAVTEDRYIVVGTGSSQLYQAVLYALSPTDTSEPISVVSAAPFYMSYPLMTDYLKSGLYKWDGDAYKFKSNNSYIELVTSPNNPDGSTRQAVVKREKGILIHDLAYYWPQYTPISFPADYDIMLFTVSKSTGHAGTRIGWALVKDEEIAKKMTKFIEINTIGVSKDSQVRAAKILHAVSDGYEHVGNGVESEKFFEYGYSLMVNRWKELRAAVNESGLFSLPEFASGICSFSRRVFEPQPAFAWLKCEGEIEDCESFLRGHKILTRGGKHFGVSPKYVRISMLDRHEKFSIFTKRLSKIHA